MAFTCAALAVVDALTLQDSRNALLDAGAPRSGLLGSAEMKDVAASPSRRERTPGFS